MKSKLAIALGVVLLGAVSGIVATQFYSPNSEPKPRAPEENPFSLGGAQTRRVATPVADDGYSNVHPDDYLGPDACVACHEKEHRQWQQHSHSRMNQNASEASVVGDFDDRRIQYGDVSVLFQRENGQYFMTLAKQEEVWRQYRVTRTVGSRYTQMYIGVQVVGPESQEHHLYSVEGKLPFGYWIQRDLWTPVSYFDSAYEEEARGLEAQSDSLAQHPLDIKWELNCLYCHNTYPYQHRIAFGRGTGFAPEDFKYSEQTAEDQWGLLQPEDLVVMGISCESCHFGGREHVKNQRESRYYPTSPDLTLTNASARSGDATSNPEVMNSICTQCHCATVTCYPNGAATWNSREALDLKSGACRQQLMCIDCHSPHQGSDHGGLRPEPEMNRRCLQCHDEYQSESERRAHTHHAPEVASCLDCHMPRIVQGLAGVLRTHHISSPTDERMLRQGVPNACNICHLDKSVEWTVSELREKWLSLATVTPPWQASYGDTSAPAGDCWMGHSQPIVRLIASDALARNQGVDALPQLVKLLSDPYAVNRIFGMFAVEKVLKRQLSADEYDPLAPHANREAMVRQLLLTLPEQARE